VYPQYLYYPPPFPVFVRAPSYQHEGATTPLGQAHFWIPEKQAATTVNRTEQLLAEERAAKAAEQAARDQLRRHLMERQKKQEETTTAKKSNGPPLLKKWSKQEDDLLLEKVYELGTENWKAIAEHLPGRTDEQCQHRWRKTLQLGPFKWTAWTDEEDHKLIDAVEKFGVKKWSQIASQFPRRTGKQCRERWHNHLDPAISREAWRLHEDRTILESLAAVGKRWSAIAKLLPGRYV
jgi:hypothetical protein